MKKQELMEKLEKLTPRSAWDRAVVSDAVDLVDSLNCSEIPNNWEELKKLLLNGAADWSAYSYGGCALVYDGDIAKHYFTPSELRRVTHKDGTIAERLQIGYAMKSTANWSYQVWAVLHNGFIISVVSVFGEIK